MITKREMVLSGMAQKSIEYWLTIVPTNDQTGYECYIKLTPPFEGLIGALIRDENGDPFISVTDEEAFSSGRRFMLDKLIGEG